ncbi:thiamine pyrophosphate-binding protein [Paracoccus seriniphilus]|uniref:Acetolactate synthase-1/2/3 large subunit n=1 Tax=Paracoccus seriniphilus TaxID=184748 RepID=A0A239Q139_9RHOB|nr:thiamine pyrophosphate-binding protein [Paracoccus seriniphilus]WCR16213.1 thiamine pyrophosphate-binding protein [Paracoccus seriniphilus]SNT76281.1 acetolactate synthase-1/2/3 large subunit [Paracoccus seriniphilus]
MRGADLLVKSLAKTGITRIFSLSGNQIMPVYDACQEAGIEIVHTRHEAAAVYMAEAYAQLTGRIGVAMVTAGAGAANAVGALLVASESETPLLLLTGDSPVAQDGMGAFQEMPQVAMIGPLTKLSQRPVRAAQLGQAVAQAMRVAQSGRPGPVHISLAFDVVNERIESVELPNATAFQRVPMYPRDGDVQSIVQAVSTARRPVVICGPQMNDTRFDGLNDLAEALDAPVIPMESPRGLKDPALGDISTILGQADLIVNLGKRVDFTLAFGKAESFHPEIRWIDVQPCEAERGRAHRNLGNRLSLSIAADARDMARALIARGAAGSSHSDWRARVETLLSTRFCPGGVTGKITSAQLCAAVQRQIEQVSDSIVVCDGGEFGQWAQAVTKGNARVINGISGAIGGGICYGLAARLARPNATVFSLMGDGTVGFHFAEFETAAREGVPCVVVIGNDMRWNAEHQIQMRDYGSDRLIGCQLSSARYDLAAAALGGHGEYVTELEQLDGALTRAVQSGKPACVNVMIEGLPAPSGAAH